VGDEETAYLHPGWDDDHRDGTGIDRPGVDRPGTGTLLDAPALAAASLRHPQPPTRDKWHRQRHEDEFVALAETLRISPAAAYMHIAAIARSNSQLADLQTVTLKDLGAAIGRSISSVTLYRRELKDAGVEEHEHRCVRNGDGTFLGLPDKIRFALPAQARARLEARATAASRKGRPTAKAPQNQPQPPGHRNAAPSAPSSGPPPQPRPFDDHRFCPTCEGERWFVTSVSTGVKTCLTCQSALPRHSGP